MAILARPSALLRKAGDDIWFALHEHPFVQGLADGTLSEVSFAFFVEQDYLFLVEYARMLGAGIARSPDLVTMTYFGSLVQEVLTVELDLYRGYARELGMDTARLANATMAPTTQAYSDFLVRTAFQADFVELPAAVLPCSWSYVEIGQRLAEKGLDNAGRYRQWIESYSSPELTEIAENCRLLVDRTLADAGALANQTALRAFITSSRYELAFWEAALQRTAWIV
jgi:thiaminase (transcriptional activator TenA)